MDHPTENEKQIRQYLLGALSAEDRARIEDRVLNDEDYFEQVLVIEQDLIDDYVREELSLSERAQFEQHFLTSPERRQEVEFAVAFQGSALNRHAIRPGPVSWWRTIPVFQRFPAAALKFSLAVAGLSLFLGGTGLIWKMVLGHRQVTQLQAERQTLEQQNRTLREQLERQNAQVADLSKQLQSEQEQIHRLERESTPSLPLLPALMLSIFHRDIGLMAEPEKLTIPPGDYMIPIQLHLEENAGYSAYRATLRTAKGPAILTVVDLQLYATEAGHQMVVVPVGSRRLHSGDYLMKLEGRTARGGFKSLGEYRFRVVKK